jgi:hypothetical protein
MAGWVRTVLCGVVLVVSACDSGEKTEVPGETIEVGMSSPELARLVYDRGGRVRRCYRDALVEHPTLEGTVAVNVVVEDSGIVSSARVADTELDDVEVNRCVAESLVGGQLPPKTRDTETMQVAFEFKPGEEASPPLVLPEPAAHRTRQLVNVQVPMPKQPSGRAPSGDPPRPPTPNP